MSNSSVIENKRLVKPIEWCACWFALVVLACGGKVRDLPAAGLDIEVGVV